MAERRMFSKRIVESAGFLKMPSSSRLLYYDLGVRADDDGIVEGFTVLRMTGATEDDLKILRAKGFVTVLNEDLVTYINDWREHNSLRADRKIDSIYKDLLIKMVPDVELLESRERSDRKKKSGTSQGQSKDGLGQDRSGQVSLGQDRSVQSRIGQSSASEESEEEDFDMDEFKNFYSDKEIDKALLDLKASSAYKNNEITNYKAYLDKILKDNAKKKDKGTRILKFNNYEQRQYDKSIENEVIGWD
ncbi:MAG: hypothetical protein ACRCX8_19455 [Sarcina sp.]